MKAPKRIMRTLNARVIPRCWKDRSCSQMRAAGRRHGAQSYIKARMNFMPLDEWPRSKARAAAVNWSTLHPDPAGSQENGSMPIAQQVAPSIQETRGSGREILLLKARP